MVTTQPFEKMNAPRHRLEQAQRWLHQFEAPEAAVVRCVLWLVSVDSFRETEMDQLEAEGQYNILSGHRAALCDLIAQGEAVVWLAKRNGWAESFTDFTLADVEATLESLRTTFQCQYRTRLHPSRKAEVGALFDAAQ